jgi:hypothetical protein
MPDKPEPDDDAREFSWHPHDRPSVGIVQAVADATDRLQRDLPQLGRTIDPDALDALLDGRGVTVSFEYASVDVTARSDGAVVIE